MVLGGAALPAAAAGAGASGSVVLTSDRPFDFGAGRAADLAGLAVRSGSAGGGALAAALGARHVTETNSSRCIAGERPRLVVGAVRRVLRSAAGLDARTTRVDEAAARD